RGMRQQVEDRDLLPTLARELRDEIGDRCRQCEIAAFDGTQHQHDCDRLSDGEQAEYRIFFYRALALWVRMTDGLVQRELAVPADGEHRAVILVGVDVLLDHFHQALQSSGIHATRVFFTDDPLHVALPWSLAT